MFIDKAKQIHGNKYDYSKTTYINNRTKICIICPDHGEFWQSPKNHLKGHGCINCGRLNAGNKYKHDAGYYLQDNIHGDRYDYSLIKNPVNKNDSVDIICPDHGIFKQNLKLHLLGHGCSKCGNIVSSGVLNSDRFLERARTVHGDKYDYSKVDYINNKVKVCIICPDHGEFWQIPNSHLLGKGCISCPVEISSGHMEIINFISGLNFDISINDRHLIAPFELDVVVPSHNLAIEFNGDYWHSFDHIDRFYHQNKYKMCRNVGLDLITVFEYDWTSRRDIILDVISRKLGLNIRCAGDIVILNRDSSSVCCGLVVNNDIVATASFECDNDWKLSDFSNKIGYDIDFGLFFDYFISNFSPTSVCASVDAKFGNYHLNGFDYLGLSDPGFKLFKNTRKIWDVGCHEFIWDRS